MEEKLKEALANRQVKRVNDDHRQPAGVLVPIFCREGEYYLLFTKRTEQVKEHKGQISFPGGGYQAEDGTLLNTALRESAEEIGLAPDRVRILGVLDDLPTQTSTYIISPFVGVIPWPYQFTANPDEIEEIIELPIAALLDKACQRQQTESIDGQETTNPSYHVQGRIIWGATARILQQFLTIFVNS